MTVTAWRVLVVDDEPHLNRLMAFVLEDAGYDVLCAEDGISALARVAEDPPDLVVADVEMPRLDGASLARRLESFHVPVILVSAIDDHVGLPDVPFIRKPFDVAALLDAVSRALAR